MVWVNHSTVTSNTGTNSSNGNCNGETETSPHKTLKTLFNLMPHTICTYFFVKKPQETMLKELRGSELTKVIR